MTLDDARQLLLSISNGRPAFPLAHLPFVHSYDHSLPLERRRLKAAMATLVVTGERWEQMMAAMFFTNVGIPRTLEHDIIGLYEHLRATDRSPLAAVIIRLGDRLRDRDLQPLENAFLADPLENMKLAPVILRPESDSYLWAALMRGVSQTDDVDVLTTAFAAAHKGHRVGDFLQGIADKPPAVLTELAARLPGRWGTKLLTAAGLRRHTRSR
jgi:hypothetical protein